jgi:hypothetical protein
LGPTNDIIIKFGKQEKKATRKRAKSAPEIYYAFGEIPREWHSPKKFTLPAQINESEITPESVQQFFESHQSFQSSSGSSGIEIIIIII